MSEIKRIVSAGLLVFIAVSIAYLAVGGRDKGKGTTGPAVRESQACTGGEVCDENQAVTSGKSSATVAYYFHRTARCRTCRALENNAREALAKELADELKEGRLIIQTVNVEELANRHFIEQYRLTGPSLILSRVQGGKEVEWKNLDRIWHLIRTPADYQAYVVSEVKAFMRGHS